MTTIKATCPVCGEVNLTSDEVRLMVCSAAEHSYYAFDCSTCVDEVRKPADQHIVSLLISGGVIPIAWKIPAEALEAKTGPPISYDDLLDFALRLRRTTHIAAFARPCQAA